MLGAGATLEAINPIYFAFLAVIVIAFDSRIV
jgi:hypothetical protein